MDINTLRGIFTALALFAFEAFEEVLFGSFIPSIKPNLVSAPSRRALSSPRSGGSLVALGSRRSGLAFRSPASGGSPGPVDVLFVRLGETEFYFGHTALAGFMIQHCRVSVLASRNKPIGFRASARPQLSTVLCASTR